MECSGCEPLFEERLEKMAQLEWQKATTVFGAFFGETSIKIPPPNICAQLTRDRPKLHVIVGHCTAMF